MALTESQEKDRQLRSKRIEVRFYLVLLIFIAFAASLAAYSAIYYLRRDGDRTRDQMNCVVHAFLSADQSAIPKAVESCKR